MTLSKPRRCFWLALVALPALWAQLYTGSLTGVVTDPSGGVIPQAKVTVIDTAKGLAYTTNSDDVGRYVLRALPPSTYDLKAEASGFSAFERKGIVLNVNQYATVDVSLQVAAAGQVVQVTDSGAPLLSTVDAVTGQTLDRNMINDLPLIGRAVFDLAMLSPGVSQPPGRAYGPSQGGNNFVSNGTRNATADILMDGVSTVNYEQNSGIQLPLYTPSVDAVQEFKLEQSNFSAEIGFTGGSVINLITRSGTNQFHGSAYEFLRNEKLDANNFFSNKNGAKIPPLRWNNFGWTVGGPIKKDRTFFFGDFDGNRQRTMATGTAGVPSAAERAGDFGELCTGRGGAFDSAGMCSNGDGQIWDPYTGVYDPGNGGPVRQNYIPFNNMARYISPGNPGINNFYALPSKAGNIIDPVAAKLMALYPLPNVNVGQANYDRYNNWYGAGTDLTDGNQFDIKLDHRFTDNDNASLKFSHGWGKWQGANLFGTAGDTNTQGPNTSSTFLGALNYSHVFSPKTLLTASWGYTRAWSNTKGVLADYPDVDPVKTLGMPSYITKSGVPALPTIYVYNGYASGGAASIGNQAWSLMRYGQETHHLISTLSHTQGRNEIKVGGEMRVHRINFLQAGAPAGVFAGYDYNTTSQYPWWGGGDGMAGLLIGAPAAGAWGGYEVPLAAATQNFQFAGFVQDNFRATDKLTLNLGLRYDLDLPRTERYNRMSYLDLAAASPISVPGLSLHGAPMFAGKDNRTIFDNYYGAIGPRFGFAYRLGQQTTVRGGYGIFYSLSEGGAAGSGAGGFDGFSYQTGLQTEPAGQPGLPFSFLRNPWPYVPKDPPGSAMGSMFNMGLDVSGPVRQWNKLPYEQSWSFSIQRQLPGNVLVDAAYVGKKGTRLYFGGIRQRNFLSEWGRQQYLKDPNIGNARIPNPFKGIITDPSSGLSGDTIAASQLWLPYPQYGSVQSNDPSAGNSIYHAFQLKVEKRFSHGLQALITYTNSKSIDNSSYPGNTTWLGGTADIAQDPNNLRLERALSEFDISQVFQFSYTYQLPIGRGKALGANMNRVLNFIAGGWQTNGIWRFDTGQPLRLALSGGQTVNGYRQNPDLTAPLKKANPFSLDQYFANPEVATKPKPYAIGTSPRFLPNFRAPGTNNASLSLFKEFPLKFREGARLEYRIEAFNALNHVVFGRPDMTVGNATFGKITSQANSPREVQMGLKLYW